MDEQNNLELWNRVSETNPTYTKRVDMRGGFTAIDPTYQLQKATAEFGSYGGKWGLRDLVWVGGPDNDAPQYLVLMAEFYYPGGAFPIAVDMKWRAGDDCYKKLMTSARSKALSMLGFNADVYLGQYDDNHYVAELRAKYSDQDELRETMLTKIREASTNDDLVSARTRIAKLFTEGAINKVLRDEALQVCDARVHELSGKGIAG